MDIGVLVDILQVNVALGILYTGLRQFRFRERLYQNIREAIEDSEFVEVTKWQEGLVELFQGDIEFSVHFHTIRDWIRELPDSEREKIHGLKQFHFSAPKQEDKGSKKFQPPNWFLIRIHKAFLRNIDKIGVWVLAIVPAMAAMWAMAGWKEFCYVTEIAVGVAVFGQFVLVVTVLVGRTMAHDAETGIRSALKYVLASFRERVAEDEVGEAQNKLREDSVPED